jgi:aryl-alcohol dehydrogenase-like predicted oxidoreductase
MIERRALGRTGLAVSVLGFGGSEIGFEAIEAAAVRRLVLDALDAGLNVIDTAECYRDSEALLGAAASRACTPITSTCCSCTRVPRTICAAATSSR